MNGGGNITDNIQAEDAFHPTWMKQKHEIEE
jgi:hypothetical protein